MSRKVKLVVPERSPWMGDPTSVHYWSHGLPFLVNPRGMLTHRVRQAMTVVTHGRRSHDAVRYWCGNGTISRQASDFTAEPPEGRLLCERCEVLAVAAGCPSAEQLTGRHVHVGRLKAHRTCCRETDQN